jgi:hypothetical protein
LNSGVADKEKEPRAKGLPLYGRVEIFPKHLSFWQRGKQEKDSLCPAEMDSSIGGLHESQLGCSGAVRPGLPGGFNLLRILANGIDLDDSVGKARQIKLWSEKTDHQHRYDDEEKGYYHF